MTDRTFDDCSAIIWVPTVTYLISFYIYSLFYFLSDTFHFLLSSLILCWSKSYNISYIIRGDFLKSREISCFFNNYLFVYIKVIPLKAVSIRYHILCSGNRKKVSTNSRISSEVWARGQTWCHCLAFLRYDSVTVGPPHPSGVERALLINRLTLW